MTGDGPSRILVVEDDAGMRRTVERILQPLYEVVGAADAGQALEALRQGEFDVALIDIQLSDDADGYAVCREIKGRSPETDVILMTGSVSQSDEKLYRSLEEDAFYFLFKPFERRVLRALVERCLRLQRERRSKESFARELESDLEKARRFQRSLLPRKPLEHSGWYLDGRVNPCDALGGDFYFYLKDRSGGVAFAVSDIVGHGVSAAMYAGMLRSTLDAARRLDPDPERLVASVLHGIDFFESARYATLFYGRLSSDGRLRYINAGHPPVLWQKRDGSVVKLGATGLFLTSVLPDRVREAKEIELRPGDRLLAYTDGVFEARDPADRELGCSGLETAFRSYRDRPVEDVLEGIVQRVRDHRAGRPPDDDATVLVVERR